MGKNVNADIEYHSTWDDVSMQPVTIKIQASILSQLPERKDTAQGFHHDAHGDFNTVTLKQLQSLMAVIGEN
jgi:hypothetical protein